VADHNKHQGADQHAEGEHAHGPGRYIVIWALLLVATLTTVITGRMDLGGANLPLALIIASVKAGLVVMFFMHLWDSEGINRLVFGVSVLFVIVLLLGVFGDLYTRQSAALPNGAPATMVEQNAGMGVRPAHAPAHAE
jgi:cytochrome c oxidase subunit 4